MAKDLYPVVSDRWLEPFETASAEDAAWVADLEALMGDPSGRKCCEVVFAAKDLTGQQGALIEIEYDDDYEPSDERIERMRSAVAEDGVSRFDYVAPGSDFIFNGRAAVRGFVPRSAATAERIEKIAGILFDDAYGTAEAA